MKSMSGESLLNLILTALIVAVGSVAVVAFQSVWLAMCWGIAITAWSVRTLAQLSSDRRRNQRG